MTDNKAVVVTGGARGLGRALAEAYAAQKSPVVIADVLEAELAETAAQLRSAGAQVIAVRADVTNEADVRSLAERAIGAFGGVHVLVNCAGTQKAIGPIWEVQPAVWLGDVHVSLLGAFLCSRAFIGNMRQARGGYILNICGAGTERMYPYLSAYCAAKAALMRFTESVAFEVKDDGVKVFGVFPGAVRSGITLNVLTSPEGKKWDPDFAAKFPRWEVPPQRAAELCLRLTSGRADALSGRFFSISYDFDRLMEQQEDIVSRDRLSLRIAR
jgi:NAD(P)-dependent dehydrogenase (short-subunit alcohol dehydrogenase family)